MPDEDEEIHSWDSLPSVAELVQRSLDEWATAEYGHVLRPVEQDIAADDPSFTLDASGLIDTVDDLSLMAQRVRRRSDEIASELEQHGDQRVQALMERSAEALEQLLAMASTSNRSLDFTEPIAVLGLVDGLLADLVEGP